MPCDYRLYPKDWKTRIRPAILERAGHKCEWCGAPDRWLRVRGMVISPTSHEAFYAAEDWAAGEGPKPALIVLTIAHIHDPDPMNCDPSNLAALCQKCHNGHDAKARAAGIRQRRAQKAGQSPLPEILENLTREAS